MLHFYLLIRGLLLQSLVPEFSFRDFFVRVVLPVLLIASIIVAISLPIIRIPDGAVRFFLMFSVDILLGGTLVFFLILDKDQRKSVLSFIKTKFAC